MPTIELLDPRVHGHLRLRAASADVSHFVQIVAGEFPVAAACCPMLSHTLTPRWRRVTALGGGSCCVICPAGIFGSTRWTSSTRSVRPWSARIDVASCTVRPARSGTLTSRARSATRMAAAAKTRKVPRRAAASTSNFPAPQTRVLNNMQT